METAEQIVRLPRKMPEDFLPENNSYELGLLCYNEEELKAFERHIRHHITDTKNQIRTYESYMIAPEDVQTRADQLSNQENSETIDRYKVYLNKLYLALERIANKTYGICKTSKKLISPARLFATPTATEEKEVKEQQKKILVPEIQNN